MHFQRYVSFFAHFISLLACIFHCGLFSLQHPWVIAVTSLPQPQLRLDLVFSLLATGLLDSTAHFLESSLDDCSCELFEKMDKSSEKVKDIALEACRNHKKVFNEIRERSAKALGFAKMLQKDLGIAAEYKVEVSSQKILELLKSSRHVKVSIVIVYQQLQRFLPTSFSVK